MKTCQANNCISPVFSHLYCARHQYLRTDKKVKPKIKLNITTVKDFSKAPNFGFPDQLTMFEALWDAEKETKGKVVCPYTGIDITYLENGSVEMWVQCFAHVLPKGRYTYWKLNPENIRIVHPNFHKCVDQGTTDIRKKWTGWRFDEWDALVIQKKEEYQQFKKDNLLA